MFIEDGTTVESLKGTWAETKLAEIIVKKAMVDLRKQSKEYQKLIESQILER